jgi:DNA anti-recombination protein RmuC
LLLGSLLVSFVFSTPALAQDATIGEAQVPRSPIEQLLEQRAALNLSADQLSRLDDIKQRLASQNEPLVNQMMTLRTEWQQARRAARNGRAPAATDRVERIRAEAEETRGRIQQNNRAAMQDVNRLLRPAQRKQLRGILQERRQDNAGRRAGGANAGSGR